MHGGRVGAVLSWLLTYAKDAEATPQAGPRVPQPACRSSADAVTNEEVSVASRLECPLEAAATPTTGTFDQPVPESIHCLFADLALTADRHALGLGRSLEINIGTSLRDR